MTLAAAAPVLQACRKWLAEEQTGHDSSEESLDRDSCYPGLSTTGESTTTHLKFALFRVRQNGRGSRWGVQFSAWKKGQIQIRTLFFSSYKYFCLYNCCWYCLLSLSLSIDIYITSENGWFDHFHSNVFMFVKSLISDLWIIQNIKDIKRHLAQRMNNRLSKEPVLSTLLLAACYKHTKFAPVFFFSLLSNLQKCQR